MKIEFSYSTFEIFLSIKYERNKNAKNSISILIAIVGFVNKLFFNDKNNSNYKIISLLLHITENFSKEEISLAI